MNYEQAVNELHKSNKYRIRYLSMICTFIAVLLIANIWLWGLQFKMEAQDKELIELRAEVESLSNRNDYLTHQLKLCGVEE